MYLDARGLVALWREALLAQAVLDGRTRGYRHHPQLERFRAHAAPREAINAYLAGILAEAVSRGYAFDPTKVGVAGPVAPIRVPRGQVAHEWAHLLAKLAERSPATFAQWRHVQRPRCHPLFQSCAGGVASWERVSG